MCDHAWQLAISYKEPVVAQWIRPRTLKCEVPGSNLLAGAAVPLMGKALYPHCLYRVAQN